MKAHLQHFTVIIDTYKNYSCINTALEIQYYMNIILTANKIVVTLNSIMLDENKNPLDTGLVETMCEEHKTDATSLRIVAIRQLYKRNGTYKNICFVSKT